MTCLTTPNIQKTSSDSDNETCCTVKEEEIEDTTGSESLLTEEKSIEEKPHKNEQQTVRPKHFFSFDDAPEYLKFNPFILSGYRGLLNTKLCMESIFWWTNETVNIWSHIFGLLLFTGLAINDVVIINIDAPFGDKIIVTFILFCFQVCMFLSALYHTFNCRSEHDYNNFLTFDLFGIALALYAVYISGIYYAYWCDQDWGNFYMLSVTVIFIMAMIIQIPRLNVDSNIKMIVFVGWALYGVVPTCHWHMLMGGFKNPIVQVLLPRVLGMYLISGTAFIIYLTKVPERFFPGKVDYLGHSHQWWHMFILLALYYWHNSGMLYVQYRMNHACMQNMNIL